jgi:hypothetical protein
MITHVVRTLNYNSFTTLKFFFVVWNRKDNKQLIVVAWRKKNEKGYNISKIGPYCTLGGYCPKIIHGLNQCICLEMQIGTT